MKRYAQNIREYVNETDPEIREDFENHIFETVYYQFAEQLPTTEDMENDKWNTIDVWQDGEVILCRTEELADMVANIIEGISGEHMAHTGYYDPDDDATEPNGPFITTGWWYVDFD